jgi:hypothetical protein
VRWTFPFRSRVDVEGVRSDSIALAQRRRPWAVWMCRPRPGVRTGDSQLPRVGSRAGVVPSLSGEDHDSCASGRRVDGDAPSSSSSR